MPNLPSVVSRCINVHFKVMHLVAHIADVIEQPIFSVAPFDGGLDDSLYHVSTRFVPEHTGYNV